MRGAILIYKAKLIPLASILDHFKIDFNNSAVSHIRCPFPHHPGDNTPSLKIYKETNSFHCFGCKASGTTYHFVKFMKQCSLDEALDYVAKTFNIKSGSLVESFNSIRLKIKNNSKSKASDVTVRNDLFFKFFIEAQGIINDNSDLALSYSDSMELTKFLDSINSKLDYFNEQFCESKTLSIDSFNVASFSYLSSLKEEFIKWRMKGYVIDVKSQLNDIMQL